MYEVSYESLWKSKISDDNCLKIGWKFAEISKDRK